MTEWAEREIELACARERANSTEEGEWEYGCACYESALKAFKSLAEDGHSGYSIMFTKQILNRLIDNKPLTPIEDTEDGWNEPYYCKKRNYKTYQCKRMSSLFKDVYEDGTVKYSDINRVSCVDINNPNASFHSGFVRDIIDEMYPIAMPYMPRNKDYLVCTEDCLTDRKNGDFDTKAIWSVEDPDGEKTYIGRFFKESESGWVEINVSEWNERLAMHNARLEAEAAEKED